VGDVQIVLLVVAAAPLGIGTMLIPDAWRRRERCPDLAKRLWPFWPRSLAEEVQELSFGMERLCRTCSTIGHRQRGHTNSCGAPGQILRVTAMPPRPLQKFRVLAP
jgi:hypothetical protein